jgi:choline-glycine betaine transporter
VQFAALTIATSSRRVGLTVFLAATIAGVTTSIMSSTTPGGVAPAQRIVLIVAVPFTIVMLIALVRSATRPPRPP